MATATAARPVNSSVPTSEKVASKVEVIVPTNVTKAMRDKVEAMRADLKTKQYKLLVALTDSEVDTVLVAMMNMEEKDRAYRSAKELVKQTVRPIITRIMAERGVTPFFNNESINEGRRTQIKEATHGFVDLLCTAMPTRARQTWLNILGPEFRDAGFAQRVTESADEKAKKAKAEVEKVADEKVKQAKAEAEAAIQASGGISASMGPEQLAEALLSLGYKPSQIQAAAAAAQRLAAKLVAAAAA